MSLLFDDANSESLRTTNTDLADGWGALTISFWLRHDALGTYQRYMYKAVNHHVIYMHHTVPTIQMAIWDSGSVRARSRPTAGAFTIAVDTWYHLVGTWDGSGDKKCRIFINGTEVSAYDFQEACTNATLLTLSAGTHIGSDQGSNYFLSGYMEHLAYWNRVLTDLEISTMFNMRLRPNHPLYLSGLQSYWPMDRPKTGISVGGDSGLSDSCVEQEGGDITGESGVPRPDWSAVSPGLNMDNLCTPHRPADYGIETLRRRRETA